MDSPKEHFNNSTSRSISELKNYNLKFQFYIFFLKSYFFVSYQETKYDNQVLMLLLMHVSFWNTWIFLKFILNKDYGLIMIIFCFIQENSGNMSAV